MSREQLDEEDLLSVVQRNSQDAIVSCLNLHWVNDLPGARKFDRDIPNDANAYQEFYFK